MRTIIKAKEAEELLSPYFINISEAIYQGFADYLNVTRLENETNGRYVNFNLRTKASLIHDYVTIRMTEKLHGLSGVTITNSENSTGLFTINFNGQAIARIKKLNKGLCPSNILTKRTKAYNNQYSIDGIPDNPTLIIIGYTLNKAMADIDGIYIICRVSNQLKWFIDVIEKTMTEQLSINYLQEEPKENVRRVKIKGNIAAKIKTGTD